MFNLLGRPTRAKQRVKHWIVRTWNPATGIKQCIYHSATKREATEDARRYIRPDLATGLPEAVYY